jgi:hypothetical protein
MSLLPPRPRWLPPPPYPSPSPPVRATRFTEQIADAVGHINSTVTKNTYRHQIADKLTAAATVMDAGIRRGEQLLRVLGSRTAS